MIKKFKDCEIKVLKLEKFATSMQSKIINVAILNDKKELLFESHNFIDLTPYMNPAPFVVYENCKLSKVYRLYR